MSILEIYNHCKICNKRLDRYTRKLAKRLYQQMFCSDECMQSYLIKRFGCCEEAKIASCVCMYAFDCTKHGKTHIGSHE